MEPEGATTGVILGGRLPLGEFEDSGKLRTSVFLRFSSPSKNSTFQAFGLRSRSRPSRPSSPSSPQLSEEPAFGLLPLVFFISLFPLFFVCFIFFLVPLVLFLFCFSFFFPLVLFLFCCLFFVCVCFWFLFFLFFSWFLFLSRKCFLGGTGADLGGTESGGYRPCRLLLLLFFVGLGEEFFFFFFFLGGGGGGFGKVLVFIFLCRCALLKYGDK